MTMELFHIDFRILFQTDSLHLCPVKAQMIFFYLEIIDWCDDLRVEVDWLEVEEEFVWM